MHRCGELPIVGQIFLSIPIISHVVLTIPLHSLPFPPLSNLFLNFPYVRTPPDHSSNTPSTVLSIPVPLSKSTGAYSTYSTYYLHL